MGAGQWLPKTLSQAPGVWQALMQLQQHLAHGVRQLYPFFSKHELGLSQQCQGWKGSACMLMPVRFA